MAGVGVARSKGQKLQACPSGQGRSRDSIFQELLFLHLANHDPG